MLDLKRPGGNPVVRGGLLVRGGGVPIQKCLVAVEEPGVDSIQESFGTVGSIFRARTVQKMSFGREHSTDAELREGTSRHGQSNADFVDVTLRFSVDVSQPAISECRNSTSHTNPPTVISEGSRTSAENDSADTAQVLFMHSKEAYRQSSCRGLRSPRGKRFNHYCTPQTVAAARRVFFPCADTSI